MTADVQTTKQAALQDLQRIPGVGKRIAEGLYNIEVASVEQLRDQNPDDLYERLCAYQGVRIDRCLLYALRCAVYFASHQRHDPLLLKWWNWKDDGYAYSAR